MPVESFAKSPSLRRRRNLCAVLAVGITLCTLLVYQQVKDHDFLVWDDFEYVVENPHVRYGLSLENVIWAIKTPYASNWHPLTWMSHMLDCDLYGLNPAGHHLNNLLLHLMNTVLLFLLMIRMTSQPWQGAFVAAIFAIHPLHVESVAWVSERKDLLSTFFFFLTCLAYVQYTRKPYARTYALCIFLFILGLASKPMLVTLPFILLLLDYWPLSRFSFSPCRSDSPPGQRGFLFLVVEKWPFFLLSALSTIVTLYCSKSDQALAPPEALPFVIRFGNGLLSYAMYLIKSFSPHDLAFFYPHPMGALSPWKVIGSALLLSAISVMASRATRERPYMIVGWLWYLITLLPVIGFLQVGSQAMADRYTYVPLIGVSIMAAWGAADILKGSRVLRHAFSLGLGVVILLLALVTSSEITYWKNGENLTKRALAVTSGNYTAHYMLGNERMRQGRTEEAILDFEEALKLRPDHFPARHNLAMAMASMGKTDEALPHLLAAMKQQPGNAGIHSSMGDVCLTQGKMEQAITAYTEALRLDSSLWKVHNNLGVAFLRAGLASEAIPHFKEALRINPGDGKARASLEIARKKLEGTL